MSPQLKMRYGSIDDLFSQIWQSGCVNVQAQHVLKTMLLEQSYTQDEQATIDRLLYAVRRGWIKVGRESSECGLTSRPIPARSSC
ncbi:MAG: hypothetical protein J7641_20530 [Cyanobacteria bacterium SID2]|nr:hypothetical protein [Cyanobacteria bacterium SID2]MBP0003501.1 hypothetical protein [Cyanobacteria bacterium SBC]